MCHEKGDWKSHKMFAWKNWNTYELRSKKAAKSWLNKLFDMSFREINAQKGFWTGTGSAVAEYYPSEQKFLLHIRTA